jgi:hypothetical protein
MSMTHHVGAHPISDWTYVVSMLSQEFGKCVTTGRVIPPDYCIPLLIDAADFFEPILDYKTDDQVPKNPVASAHAISVYGKIVRELLENSNLETKDVVAKLREIHKLVASLNEPRVLSDDEKQLALFAQRFFATIKQRGNSERYVRAVSNPGLNARDRRMRQIMSQHRR